MPKRFRTSIGHRDLEILTAVDRTPLTAAQLCTLSETFSQPFHDVHNLRRRLRALAGAGVVKSWPYAIATDGRSPRYFRLTFDGYRMLYGLDAALPHRRRFEEISHGHHHHTFALAEVVTHLCVMAKRHGASVDHFAGENSVSLHTDAFTVRPDAAFVVTRSDGRGFPFVLELDNGTERVRTRLDTESIERKLRAYDAHQAGYSAHDPQRYLVLFVTTRSQRRLDHILDSAGAVMQQPNRTVFIGCSLQDLIDRDPFTDALFRDHRGLRRMLIPQVTQRSDATQPAQRERQSVIA
ncbi:MAG: replication-relaxation family protein [Planctomycetaceae bacterium]